MKMQLEIVDDNFQNSELHQVLRVNSRGDYVLDTKPRRYIEVVSGSWGNEGLRYKNREGTYSWIDCYIKTSKDYVTGYARQVEHDAE